MAETESQLDNEIAHYRLLNYSLNTKRSYSSYHKSYISFCVQMGYSPVPVTQIVLCRYAAFLARRLCFASIKKKFQYENL